MGKKVKKNRNRTTGEAELDLYYQELYGPRWEPLKKALLEQPLVVPYSEGLIKPYYLDEASILAARTLDPQQDDAVLDLCAAPGGKSLVIASLLGPGGILICNDRSSARRGRLKMVLEGHLPGDSLSRITVTGHDAARWGQFEKNVYDRVLLDIPCSSERHLLHSPGHLEKWSRSRGKHLSVQGYAMIASALEVVKPEGIIVYSTCALNPGENDGVIKKLLHKRSGRCRVVPVSRSPDTAEADITEYGIHILPDRCGGRGPMYICVLKKENDE